jgi:hypothetical protein
MDYCLTSLTATSDTPSADDTTDENTVTFDVTQKATSNGGPIFWGNVQPASTQQDPPEEPTPACAKRVGDIFDDPQFFIHKEAHVWDTRQGAEGDCWFISSLGCLCVDTEFPKLVAKLCPTAARDEKVGVYGFVFFRDGEWISEIIDDKLYISAPDYDDCDDERRAVWDRSHSRLDPEVSREEYRKTFQSGSDALFYGSCADPNETWVPLIEKAFAKAHGDYNAIDGGWPGQAILQYLVDHILTLRQRRNRRPHRWSYHRDCLRRHTRQRPALERRLPQSEQGIPVQCWYSAIRTC